MPEVSADQLETLLAQGSVLIDVRTEDEFDAWHHPSALHMPLHLLKLKATLLNKSESVVVCCNTGRRSKVAAALLSDDGYSSSFCIVDKS